MEIFIQIEASPKSYKKLELLTSKNSYKNCNNYNIAISDTNGRIWIEEKDNYRINQINENFQGQEIASLTLDKFVEDNQIREINFLKVNIEGSELQMIKA